MTAEDDARSEVSQVLEKRGLAYEDFAKGGACVDVGISLPKGNEIYCDDASDSYVMINGSDEGADDSVIVDPNREVELECSGNDSIEIDAEPKIEIGNEPKFCVSEEIGGVGHVVGKDLGESASDSLMNDIEVRNNVSDGDEKQGEDTETESSEKVEDMPKSEGSVCEVADDNCNYTQAKYREDKQDVKSTMTAEVDARCEVSQVLEKRGLAYEDSAKGGACVDVGISLPKGNEIYSDDASDSYVTINGSDEGAEDSVLVDPNREVELECSGNGRIEIDAEPKIENGNDPKFCVSEEIGGVGHVVGKDLGESASDSLMNDIEVRNNVSDGDEKQGEDTETESSEKVEDMPKSEGSVCEVADDNCNYTQAKYREDRQDVKIVSDSNVTVGEFGELKSLENTAMASSVVMVGSVEINCKKVFPSLTFNNAAIKSFQFSPAVENLRLDMKVKSSLESIDNPDTFCFQGTEIEAKSENGTVDEDTRSSCLYDGRSLAPDEELPVHNNDIKERAGTDNLVSQKTKTKNPEAAVTTLPDDQESVSGGVEFADTKDSSGLDFADTREKHKRSKEEEELEKRAEELRKEEEEAIRLQEQVKLEEKAKAEIVLARKKRRAERAQARAAIRAQKEAEEKEKEKEKKARKKKKKKKSAGEESKTKADVEEEPQPAVSIETPTETPETAEESKTTSTKSQKRRQLTKQNKAKAIIPPPLRKPGKRKTEMWVWILVTVMIVLVLFFLGNGCYLGKLGMGRFS